MEAGGLEPNEVEHTFQSGRTMLIRKSLPMQVLLFKAVEDGDMEVSEGLTALFNAAQDEEQDEADVEVSLHVAAKLTRTVVETMFLRPRVFWDWASSDLPPEFRRSGAIVDGVEVMVVEDLHDSEVSEVVELAMKAVGQASRFRRNGDGPEPGERGPDVVKKPKRAAGSKSRKS